MIDWLISLAVDANAIDVERLRQTAPTLLTAASAREHLIAAKLAANEFGIRDEALLLSIAHHESGYNPAVASREWNGMTSCGLMQVSRKGPCDAESLSVLGGYRAGAKVLKGWLDVCRGAIRCALVGYAGGFYLIDYCRKGSHANCGIAEVFLKRAAWIRGRELGSSLS